MKKATFWTYLKRGLLALICVIVISFIGIFNFDRYEAAVRKEYKNDLPTEYWAKLEGFKSYQELVLDDNKDNVDSTEYQSPFYKEDGSLMTTKEKIDASRYQEELNYVIRPIQTRLNSIENEIKNLTNITQKSKADWIFEMLDLSYLLSASKQLHSVMLGSEYTGTEAELNDSILHFENSNIYKQVVASGYSGNLSDFVAAIIDASGTGEYSLYEKAVNEGLYTPIHQNATPSSKEDEENRKAWVLDVCGFNSYNVKDDFSAYDFMANNGYKGTFTEWVNIFKYRTSSSKYETMLNAGYVDYMNMLESDYNFFMALYNDKGKGLKAPIYDLCMGNDPEKLNRLENEKNDLIDTINYAKEKQNNLLPWSDYFNRYRKVLENDNYEFHFSFGLTTFKIVDKRTGYEWKSNPDKIDNPALKNQQLTILSLYYGETGGALNEYSNYTYAVSPIEDNTRVTPNYAVKVINEGDTKVIQVWYHMEARKINYTAIPQYYSEARKAALLEQNKDLAQKGITDSAGNVIVDMSIAGENYETSSKTKSGSEKELQTQKIELQKIEDNIATLGDSYKGEYDVDKQACEDRINELEQLIARCTSDMKKFAEAREAYSRLFEAGQGNYYQPVTPDNPNTMKDYTYYEYAAGTKYEFMSAIMLEKAYRWLYDWCGYTEADLIEDNNEFGVEIEFDRIAFEGAIEYRLTEDGLTVNVPGNAIKEIGGHTICNIDVLPYFTSTPEGVEGYTVIPDGSGSVMLHDNGKSNYYEPYIKRIYTTDLAKIPEVKAATNYDIMLPMYSVVNTDSAIIVDVERMASQLELRATTSGYGTQGESNNRNYFRAYVRESQDVYIGSYAKEAVRKFTNDRMQDDIIINYHVLGNTSHDAFTYSDIAAYYREILIERYGLTQNDKTDKAVLDMDVIGAYTYTNNVAGIMYEAKDTMTTFEQLSKMIDEIKEECGVEYFNAFFKGWRKEALVNASFKKIKMNSLLGSKSKLKDLTSKENVTIYPYVMFGQIEKYQESFGANHYTSRDVIGEINVYGKYHLVDNLFIGRPIYSLSPHYYTSFAESLTKNYAKAFSMNNAKKTLGINAIAIESLGSDLTGDYKKNQEMFKNEAIEEQIKSLEIIAKQVENINLYKPYDYAFKYVTHARDIPFESTKKEILDYSIPFYQLVTNGLFDYSGESINANIEDGIDFHIMKLIETGANPQFTFTYDTSTKLIKTEYNNYYNTEYKNWIEDVKQIMDALNQINIYSYRLISHERLENNVYLVTYGDDINSPKLQIVLNYSFASVVYNGETVYAKSYKVL